MESDQSRHFINHPSVTKLFEDFFPILGAESDRGVVLVGSSHIDQHLKKLFEEIRPKGLSGKMMKEMLSATGPLGTHSGKLKLAYLTRLIPERLFRAIDALRDLRNDLAHGITGFSLKGREQQIAQVCNLGDDVPIFINRIACECLVKRFVSLINEAEQSLPDSTDEFEDREAALKFFLAQPALTNRAEELRPRFELAIGIVLICALLIEQTDRAKSVLGEHTLLSSLSCPVKVT